MDRKLSQILALLQGPDRREGRRPPHDNFGRPPRNDDDDGDDIPPPCPRGPGAGIRDRPPADVPPPADNTNTGPGAGTGAIPSANHLNLTGPALATIRPIVNVEPEEVRELEPRAPAAAPPRSCAAPAPPAAPAPDQPAEAADPDPDYIIPIDDLHAAMKALSDKHKRSTYPELASVVKTLGQVHPEYSASESLKGLVLYNVLMNRSSG